MEYPPHFPRRELILSDYAIRNGIDNTPQSDDIEINLLKLAYWLEQLREKLQQPIIITSGYRCPELNKALGGSSTSAHMQGLAADIHCPNMSILDLAKFVTQNMGNYDQVIYEFREWVHVGLSDDVPRLELLTAAKQDGKVMYLPGFV